MGCERSHSTPTTSGKRGGQRQAMANRIALAPLVPSPSCADCTRGGINKDITNSYWKSPHLQKYISRILRARCDRTRTQKWKHRVLPAGKRPASARCQLCREEVDETALHSMEECTFGPKMVLRKARHNTAALAPITEAIRTGKHSGCYIHVDGTDSFNPHDIGGNPSKVLMAWLRDNYQQSSFPDRYSGCRWTR
jgi:hypothetical protein